MWLQRYGSGNEISIKLSNIRKKASTNSLLVPTQYGWMYPPFTQTLTCPIDPTSPNRPAFVCKTWTAFALDRFKRRLPNMNGRAGSRAWINVMRSIETFCGIPQLPIIFLSLNRSESFNDPQMIAPNECPIQLSKITPLRRKSFR